MEAAAQQAAIASVPDSATAAAAPEYDAGAIRRFLLGGHYRTHWATPITVPVLNLQRFGGGLRPDKISGGFQTRSLRFKAARGREYVFRPVRKDSTRISEKLHNTIVGSILEDATAATHPAGAVLSEPLLAAAGVLHPHPKLVMMPDDPALGKFQREFAGRIGTIEEFPGNPDGRRGFADATHILDSEELLPLLNKDPKQPLDARAYLRARLVDMLINDWDRHPGQWKWGRGGSLGPAWQPIPRDRDRAFASFSGVFPTLARFVVSNATPFRGEPPNARGLVYNSLGMDRRLLAPLTRAEWDTVTADVMRRITDAVIDTAVARQPPEYQSLTPSLAAHLRLRRDGLRETASRFYQLVNQVADIHATDADDRARVELGDSSVRIELRGRSGGRPYFARNFRAGETSEVRLYLHGGDDRAVVTGKDEPGIPVRIVGGNGNNTLIDSSTSGLARLYENGKVNGVSYGPDTLFDRRPWIERYGKPVPSGRDFGAKFAPVMGLAIDRDLGLIPRVGFSFTSYGFLRRPYARRWLIEAEHATHAGHGRLRASVDQRMEDSRLHWELAAQMSDLEVLRFHGFGNNTPGGKEDFFEVNLRQWSVAPAIGYRIGTENNLTLGPVLKYSETHHTANTFLDAAQPYGAGDFGQVGAAVRFHVDERDDTTFPESGLRALVEAAVYPAMWDVQSTFGSLRAVGISYFKVPIPTHPVLAIRLGAKKVFGDFPYHEAAFLGGGSTVRNLTYQRYAGDAAVDATAELRFRLVHINFILPMDIGVFPLWEAGRVWMDGESPGGWHAAYGGGVWIGLPDPSRSISISVTDGDLNRMFVKAGLSF